MRKETEVNHVFETLVSSLALVIGIFLFPLGLIISLIRNIAYCLYLCWDQELHYLPRNIWDSWSTQKDILVRIGKDCFGNWTDKGR
jgi:hypothetical protein